MVGQRALLHKQHAVVIGILVQHHPLLDLAVRVLLQLLALVGRKVAHGLCIARALQMLKCDNLTDELHLKVRENYIMLIDLF